jgi:hypothetical protein
VIAYRNPTRTEYLALVREALGRSRLTLKERAAILLAAEGCAADRRACWDGHSFNGVACPVKRAGFVPTYARFDSFIHSYDKTMRSLVGIRGPGIVGIREDDR